ncbi:MAG: ABC transporter ATP-binding protein [Phycisphaerae bacterium]
MDVVAVENLLKDYGAVRALDGLTMAVPAGSIFGFLGPNGAGKTTAIRILMGLLRPTDGRATVFGRDCWRDSLRIRRRVGYLPGDLRLYAQLTGRSTLGFLAAARGGGLEREIRRLCDRFQMDLDRRVRSYSRGNRQKLGLIQALMHRPDLLILDEPTASLDPLIQQVLYDELRAAAGRGATVLFSSHTLSEVELLCEFVAIVRDGRLVESNRVQALRARAIRRVEFTVSDGQAAPPDGFQLRARHEDCYVGAWRGPMQPLLAWMAAASLRDVIIAPPDLEELFLSYYDREAARPAESASQHSPGRNENGPEAAA